jgi:hypothetical protein
MPHACVPPAGRAAPGGRHGACALALVLLSLFTGGGHAELLGTHPHRHGDVHLMTEPCRDDDPGAGQLVRQTVEGRERRGCWQADRDGNPVVTWSDGSELVLEGDQVRLSRRMAGLLAERPETPPPRPQAPAAPPATRPRGNAPTAEAPEPPRGRAAAPPDFARPAWCPEARFPHERLVCTDAELADRDLRLASLWRPYRRTLSRAAESWHKRDYFRRLKACGADKPCILMEQETQMRRYREGLPAEG